MPTLIPLMAELKFPINTVNTCWRIMPKSKSIRLENLLATPPGRVGLVILTVLVAAGTLSLAFSLDFGPSAFILKGMVLTGIGLISGITARILLRHHTHLLRTISAFTAVLWGMGILSIITGGAVGLNLTQNLSGTPDWLGILQVLWTGSIAFLAVHAWSEPTRLKETVKSVQKGGEKKMTKGTQPAIKSSTRKLLNFSRIISSINRKKTNIKIKVSWLNIIKSTQNLIQKLTSTIIGFVNWKPIGWAGTSTRVKLNRTKPVVKRSAKKLRVQHRPASITLVGDEEHNCPFCLEIVTKNDPRGRKICATCKTWHHADCWDTVGECQVPHQH